MARLLLIQSRNGCFGLITTIERSTTSLKHIRALKFRLIGNYNGFSPESVFCFFYDKSFYDFAIKLLWRLCNGA